MAGRRAARQPKSGKAATIDEPEVMVRLPADCRLAAQAALKMKLQDTMDRGDIVVDAGGLERIDTAALQLLVVFRRELERSGGELRWHGTNQTLHEAAALLGLEELLNLPATTLA
ncbi:MAG: STAS domain-containing protein [Rhodanobacter sp.]